MKIERGDAEFFLVSKFWLGEFWSRFSFVESNFSETDREDCVCGRVNTEALIGLRYFKIRYSYLHDCG